MNRLFRTAPLLVLLALGACAQMTHGTTQSIRVTASPVGAESVTCTAENEAGSYTLPVLPMHLQVQRARGPLVIRCQNTQGWRGVATVDAYLDAPGLAGNPVAGAATGATLGNAVFVGSSMAAGPAAAIGAGVGGVGLAQDLRTGAAWGYPAQVVVEMQPPPANRMGVESARGAPLTPVAVEAPAQPRPRVARHVRAPRAAGSPSK